MHNLKEGYIQKPYTTETKRYCQYLRMQPDDNKIDEYKFWHQRENIWKEIPEGIRKAGILDMEIYLIGNIEFMIVETPLDFDWDEAFGKLASFERQAEWEDFMSQFHQAQMGARSDQKWHLIERIFSLKDCLGE